MTETLVLRTVEETLEAVDTRRYAAYTAYKPSGVEWLGDVPEHWDVKRLKFLSRINPSASEINGLRDEDEISFVPMEAVGEYGGLKLDAEKRLDEVRSGFTYFRDQDVVIAKITPCFENGKGSLARDLTSGVAFGTTELHVVRSGSQLNAAFLFYLTISDAFRRLGASEMYGAGGQKRVPTDFVRDFPVGLPPLEEQRAIARFLDEQTRKIDDLLEAKRNLLDLLKEKRQAVITHAVTRGLDPAAKLKPSGVEWLGDVPEHWDVSPLYARYDAVLGKMLDEKRIAGESLVPYLRNVDVQWDYINTTDLPEMDIPPADYERFTVREGDLLVCEGGEVGRCAIWQSQLTLCGFQKAIHRLRAQSARDIPRFLFYVLRCAASYGAFVAGSNPNTIPHLTGEKLRRHRFPMPPAKEQQFIVRFLDEETQKIDDLESVVREAIETLELLRASIISATVTGKIDVREERT